MPVLNTCKAHLEDIEKCITSNLDNHDAIKACQGEAQTPFTYCFMFKASNNASISRESVFKFAGAYVQSKNKSNKVDFDAPEYVLFIQIICNICYISFMRNYFKYRKYNLIEMGSKYSVLGQQAKLPAQAESSETAPKETEESVPEPQEAESVPQEAVAV